MFELKRRYLYMPFPLEIMAHLLHKAIRLYCFIKMCMDKRPYAILTRQVPREPISKPVYLSNHSGDLSTCFYGLLNFKVWRIVGACNAVIHLPTIWLLRQSFQKSSRAHEPWFDGIIDIAYEVNENRAHCVAAHTDLSESRQPWAQSPEQMSLLQDLTYRL